MSDPPSPELARDNVWDVLLASVYSGTQPCGWPLGEWTQLDSDLWVGISNRILENIATIMDACEPAGYCQDNPANGYRWQPTRLFGTYYAFVNTNPSHPDDFNWDPDNRILHCVGLSRLVHPTAIGFEYAARIKFDEDGELKRVFPGSGHRAYAVSNRPQCEQRQWLTQDEWSEVAELLKKYPFEDKGKRPRIGRALFYFEKTAREYYFADRCELLVRTAEILWGRPFGRSKQGRGARFKSGLTRLANEFEIEISDDHADRAWYHRSRVTHGIDLPQTGTQEYLKKKRRRRPGSSEATEDESDMLEAYLKVEAVLRMTIRRAIEDDDFATRFESETSLEDWLTNAE